MAKVCTHMTMSLDGFIADPASAPHRFDDAVVIQGRRATHVRYRVRR